MSKIKTLVQKGIQPLHENSPSISFKQLLWRSGFTDLSVKGRINICEYLKTTDRNLRRWISNDNPPPLAVEMLHIKRINLRQSTSWDGFVFRDDYIVTPDGARLSCGSLRFYTLYMQLAFAVLENNDYQHTVRTKVLYDNLLEMCATGTFD